MGEYTDIRIHGAERKPGGRYGVVEISGSGKFDGSVECDSFRLSGAGEVENGGLTVHGAYSARGKRAISIVSFLFAIVINMSCNNPNVNA